MTEMIKKTKDPIDEFQLWGIDPACVLIDEMATATVDETICLILNRACCCWDGGECKNPNGRCDGE